MSINRHAPFVYHWPEHGVWAFFRPTWDWRNQSGGTIECVVRPLRSEQINGRTVEWYDTKPVLRLAFVVEPRKLVSYKRCADAPSTLPEQVTPTEFDARLEGCYSAVYQDAVYRYESFEAPIVTLTTGPGTLPEGWESQLPYGYLISPVCAASAPCVMPEAYVWRLVVAEARRVVKTRSDLCLTDDYENVGHVSVGKVTADHKRIRARSFFTREYVRRHGGSTDHSTIIVSDIHGDNLTDGQAKLKDLLEQVREAGETPTRQCPRCKGCGEIGFTEPDVLAAPATTTSKGKRQ